MDWSGAVNLMLFSAEVEGKIGARWDIFKPSDGEMICRYLKDRGHQTLENPIHQQAYFLEEDDLQRLEAFYGVKPYSFDQKPNECVFILVGAAHQVNQSRLSKIYILTFFL
jgi:hypothetical protein